MEKILYNARLRSLDGLLPENALGIKDGKIAAIGDKDALDFMADDHTEWIDLGGRTVYPGFGDSHMHLLHFGVTQSEVELKDAHSLEEVQQLICDFIRENEIPAGRTVYAHGWNQDLFPDKHIPTRGDLDAVSKDHPIVASRICGHLATTNTPGLQKFGISAETRVPGGEIYLNGQGEPTGVVSENAVSMLYTGEAVSVERAMEVIRSAASYAASKGITCVHSEDLLSMAGCAPDTVIAAYRGLAEEDKLDVRVYEQCQLIGEEAIERFEQEGYASGQHTGLFTLYSLKIISDGSLGGRTAYLKKPYVDAPETRGMLCFEPEQIERMVLMAHRRGMPAVIHCIGDAAMEICLNAIEKAQKACPEQHPRHGIIHCQITDEKLLDRFAELGVQAYVQPVFLEYDAHIVDDRVGRELGRTRYAWRSLLERGVNVSAGSDCPVENMDSLPNIYCAVTRMDFDGKPEGGWNPQEDLSPEQALRIFTRNVAAVTGEEDHRGDLIPGNDADLTILDEDFFEVPAEHIKDIQPYMTIVDGKIRFRAK